jgi:hypothetical protein
MGHYFEDGDYLPLRKEISSQMIMVNSQVLWDTGCGLVIE